jgi:hypothetical protein
MMKFIEAVAWGGSKDDETLDDVLGEMKSIAPSLRWSRFEVTNGGWPVYEFACDESDLKKIADYMSIEVEDLGAVKI